MQVSKYSNFVNSINSEETKEQYEYCLTRFLEHYQIDLDSFLALSQQEYLTTLQIICYKGIKTV